MIWSEISCDADRSVAKKCYTLDNDVKQIKSCQYYALSDSDEFQDYHTDIAHSNGESVLLYVCPNCYIQDHFIIFSH